jgi:hypothetical protein
LAELFSFPLFVGNHQTGREKAEHYQIIEDLLDTMELALEIKNDERKHP